MFSEELALITARGSGGLDDLIRRSELKIVVLRAGCSYRQRLEAVLAGRGVVGLRCLEFGTLEAILGCVKAGLGVTLLPKSVVNEAARGGAIAVHELPPEEARVDTLFIRRRDAFVSSALNALLDSVRPAPPRMRRAR